ncbi:MAG: SigB/SigF/SigG family RNA polymerase sigma factor [Acidimicrobiales bacterium]
MPDDREIEQERFRALRASGDATLRDRLIEDYLWIARHGARRFGGRGEANDDLLQVASLALVKAVDRFDPELNLRFATFAMPTVIGELRRHFRDRTWSMRVSRRLKDLHLELRTASELLTHELGHPPSVAELADALDTTVEEVLEAMEAGATYRAASLDAGPVGSETDDVAIPGVDDPELELTSDRMDVQVALNDLPHRDRRVVYLRFYLGLTQAEIAEEIGVSQVHVSRILRSTLARLGDQLQDSVDIEEQA